MLGAHRKHACAGVSASHAARRAWHRLTVDASHVAPSVAQSTLVWQYVIPGLAYWTVIWVHRSHKRDQ